MPLKIFKKYDSDKTRTTPILSVDGKSIGFISDSDAASLKYSQGGAITVNTAAFSSGDLRLTFKMVRFGPEIFMVVQDRCGGFTISVTTHAAFNGLLKRYSQDSRWTKVGCR